jgi:hypothetical protein
MIFVYYHENGEAPSFEIPDIPEQRSAKWLPVGRIEWTFRSHIQEVVENSVDLPHFQFIHKFAEQARMLHFELRGHTFTVTVAAPKIILGVAFPADLTITYHGMGLAIGRNEHPFRLLSLVTCLPIDGELLRQRITMFVHAPRVPLARPVLGAILRWHVRRDVEDEVTVLEHKRYLERPVLVAGDGPIMKVRRWCQQFHAARKEAPRAASATQGSMVTPVPS